MINKLLSLFSNENPSYKGKERHNLFTKSIEHTVNALFLNQAKQTVNMQMHMCMYLFFTFLILMPKKKVDVQI